MKKLSLLAVILIANFVCLPAVAQTDYQAEGLTFGQANLSSLHNNVNSTNAQSAPFYTSNPAQESEFGGPSLFDLGAQKITTCASATPGSDPIANQECDAVNYLAKNPLQPYDVSPNDPIITGIGSTISGASGTVVGTGCTTVTTTTPAAYTTEVCNEYYLANNESCTEGQVVDVTANSNFACDVTTEKYYTQSCTDDTVCTSDSDFQCVSQTFLCSPGSMACCNFTISCTGPNSGTIRYQDCCNLPGGAYESSTTTFTDMAPFENGGWNYDPLFATSVITCNPNTGGCTVEFTNYQCESHAIQGAPTFVPNAFGFGTAPACHDNGGCSYLESLTQ